MGPSRPLPQRRHLAARPRRRITTVLRRQPLVFWFVAILAALSTYLFVDASLEAAAEGAEAYGDLVPVAVATRDLEPGRVIAPSDVEVVSLPARLVPLDAVGEPPRGRSVRYPIVEGEALVSDRLAPDGAVGIAAMLDPDHHAIAIPLPQHRAPMQVGQLVDVLATVDPDASRGREPTSVVARGATVLAVDDGGVTVSASMTDTARIATALSYAVVSLAVVG